MLKKLLLLLGLSAPSAFAGSPCVYGPGPTANCKPIALTESGGGTDRAIIRAPASLTAPYTLTLPINDGDSGQFLQTDGSGALTWANPETGDHVNSFYVSKDGNDTTGDGSLVKPWLTISKAMTEIGSATDSTEFNLATERFYSVKVLSGVYVENVTVPLRPHILLDLSEASITGDVSVPFDQSIPFGGTIATPRLILKGSSARPFSGNYATNGVVGNITIDSTVGSSLLYHLELRDVSVNGGITKSIAGGGGTFTLALFVQDSMVSGTISSPTATGGTTLYASNIDTSSSNAFGAITGNVNLNIIRNVRFNGIVTTSGCGGRWFNTTFAAVAHDFTGSSCTVSADSNSVQSFETNVPTKGSVAFTRLDTAFGTGYAVAVGGDWTGAPTRVNTALDELASTRGGFIGKNISGGTVGSLLFVGAGPNLSQDNANLFWDDTNNRLGIGSTAPGQKLTVEGTIGILEGGGTPTFHTVFQGGDQAADVTYTLPPDDGDASEVLTTNGSGVLSWEAPAAGGMSIGGAVTSGTAGSILFVGTGPVLAQDNAEFFWDATNDRLGLGTTTPNTTLKVVGDAEIDSSGLVVVPLTVTTDQDVRGLELSVSGDPGPSNGAVHVSTTGDGDAVYAQANTGRALVLGNNSNEEIGLSTPTGTTDYNLVLPDAQGAAGTAPINDGAGNLTWEPVLRTCSIENGTAGDIDTDCPAGSIVTGGGAYCGASNLFLTQNIPLDADTWQGQCSDAGGTPDNTLIEVHAVCCVYQ